jgi:hypothetical protein
VSAATVPVEIAGAVAELESAFPGRVQIYEDPAGLVVAIQDIALSKRWTPLAGTLWFLIPYHYPDSAIYPFYVTDAQPTGGMINGLQDVTWRNEPAIQVSLRHASWNPKLDTALGSALQARAWLATY